MLLGKKNSNRIQKAKFIKYPFAYENNLINNY